MIKILASTFQKEFAQIEFLHLLIHFAMFWGIAKLKF